MDKVTATNAWSITGMATDNDPIASVKDDAGNPRIGRAGGPGDLGVHAFNFKQGDPPYLLKADIQGGATFDFPAAPSSAALTIRTRGSGRNYGPGAPVDLIVERVPEPGHSVDVPGIAIARATIPHGGRELRLDLDVGQLVDGPNILRVRADFEQVIQGERTFAQFASWRLPAEIEFEASTADTVQEVSDFWADSLGIDRKTADTYREVMTPLIIEANESN